MKSRYELVEPVVAFVVVGVLVLVIMVYLQRNIEPFLRMFS